MYYTIQYFVPNTKSVNVVCTTPLVADVSEKLGSPMVNLGGTITEVAFGG